MRERCAAAGIPQPRSLRFRISDLARGRLDAILNVAEAAEAKAATHQSTVTDDTADAETVDAEAAEAAAVRSRLAAPNPHTGTDAEWGAYYASAAAALAARGLQYPLVVKPLSGAGSNFVRKVATFSELVEVMTLFAQQCDEVNSSPFVSAAGNVTCASLNNSSNICTSSNSNSATIAAAVVAPESPATAAAATTGPQSPPTSVLLNAWRHWGLSHLDSAFMLEELILGHEFDLDMVIQRGVPKLISVNYNYPTAGHGQYFMEAGGLVPAHFPLREQIAARVLGARFLRAFGEDISGAVHFEGMMARNMQWAEQDPAFQVRISRDLKLQINEIDEAQELI